jgi:hypothetical protein
MPQVKVSKKQKKKKSNISQTVIVNVGGKGGRGGRRKTQPQQPLPMLPPISSSIVVREPSIDFVSLFKNAISSFSQPLGGIKVESLLEQVKQPTVRNVDDSKEEAKIHYEQGHTRIPMDASPSEITTNARDTARSAIATAAEAAMAGEPKEKIIRRKPNVGVLPL